jgi:hypothetical protein
MKQFLTKIAFVAVSCALVVATFSIIGPRAVKAVVATLVQVVNTQANPVPNQDVDSLARNFYQTVSNCSQVTNPCVISFPAVPTGKRLIIEQVSATAVLPPAAAGTIVQIELRGGSVFQFLPIVPTPANFGGEFEYVAHQRVLAAYDAGEVPEVDAFAATGNTFSMVAHISGYMINYP